MDNINNRTWLQLGMYIDYKHYVVEFKIAYREKLNTLHKIIKHKWDNNIDMDTFTHYFREHSKTPEDFNLV
jgi:hypothetical protein